MEEDAEKLDEHRRAVQCDFEEQVKMLRDQSQEMTRHQLKEEQSHNTRMLLSMVEGIENDTKLDMLDHEVKAVCETTRGFWRHMRRKDG